jgi:hypothetical protein
LLAGFVVFCGCFLINEFDKPPDALQIVMKQHYGEQRSGEIALRTNEIVKPPKVAALLRAHR